VIYHCNADYETTMASTLTVAFLHKRQLYVVSVGDSRAYHYSADKGLQRITKDHTLAANLVDAQLLKPEEVYKSEKRKQLYRYLGQSSAIPIDFFSRPIEINDLILLCTNGLWHMVRDERLAELLKQGQAGDTQKLARRLVDEANLCGGEGNVSAIVVRVL
jgi:serine/threonine protein phosphatase PrpC